MGLGRASAPQVIKCPDHAARAQVHATIAALAQLIERVSRPKLFVVEVTKGIENDFLNRRRDVAWIPRHRPQRNVASSFDHEARDFWDRERINLSPPSPLANGSARQAPIFSVRQ